MHHEELEEAFEEVTKISKNGTKKLQDTNSLEVITNGKLKRQPLRTLLKIPKVHKYNRQGNRKDSYRRQLFHQARQKQIQQYKIMVCNETRNERALRRHQVSQRSPTDRKRVSFEN